MDILKPANAIRTRAEKQPDNLKSGDLINPYNRHTLTPAEVAAYNRYTAEINRETYPHTREFLLDQRHRFFVSCGMVQ